MIAACWAQTSVDERGPLAAAAAEDVDAAHAEVKNGGVELPVAASGGKWQYFLRPLNVGWWGAKHERRNTTGRCVEVHGGKAAASACGGCVKGGGQPLAVGNR